MARKIEIRIAKKGFIVSAARGPILNFKSVSERDAVAALELANAGLVSEVREFGAEVIYLPPTEWAVGAADEALSIVRKLMEGDDAAV